MILPHNAQCPSVRDAVVNDNEPGSVQKPAPRESQIGVHIQLRWFAVENLLLCWERREFSRSRSIFLEGDSSDRAGTRAIPPNTRTISNTNSKKFIIVLRLDESDDASGRPLSTPERVPSDQTQP